MSINYSLVARAVNPSQQDGEKKVYATYQSKETLSLEEFAKHISDHNSLFDESVILGVLTKMCSCLREQLLDGNMVSFGDIGTFGLILKGSGADSATNFTASNIKEVKVRFAVGNDLKGLIDDATFNQVATKSAQAEALAAEKSENDTAVGYTSDDEVLGQ